MQRRYEKLLSRHLWQSQQIAIVVGPRQVGKTASVRLAAGDHVYFSWERLEDRRRLLAAAGALAADLGLGRPGQDSARVIFDGMQSHRRWQRLVEEFLRGCAVPVHIAVTGTTEQVSPHQSLYRMHPLSVAELIGTQIDVRGPARPLRPPADGFAQLLRFGGFPEPFLRASTRFSNRWRQQHNQLFRQDLRERMQIQQVDQAEVLRELLAGLAGQPLNYSSLAQQIGTSVDTVRRWIDLLERQFFCFTVRPWLNGVPKSLRQQPKLYLYDWSQISAAPERRQNLVASHLLKAVHWWTDVGLGTFQLCYLRDKTKRAVDFVVIRDGQPWFLVQVGSSGRQISAALRYFHGLLATSHAFQVSFDLGYLEQDCFTLRDAALVPATTLLSQLA